MNKVLQSLLLLIVFTTFEARSQSPHAVELSSTYNFEIYPERYHYRVCGLEATYRYTFAKNSWCSGIVTGSLHYSQTRFSAVAFPTDDYRKGIEVGFTAGLLWDIYIFKDYLTFYMGGFIGPMYTPKMPARQGGYVNFSDNLCAGFNVKLTKQVFADLKAGYRHMSNAGMFNPNYGLNSCWYGLGVIYKI